MPGKRDVRMVKIPKRGKLPFLKPTDVIDGDLAAILENPRIQSADDSKYGKEQTIITVKIKRTNEIHPWRLNTTSNDRLVEAYSEDGDLWKGHEVRIQKRFENVRGEDRYVLYAIPTEQTKISTKQMTKEGLQNAEKM